MRSQGMIGDRFHGRPFGWLLDLAGLGRVASGLAVLVLAMTAAAAEPADPALLRIVEGPQRAPENVARDAYRNPAETLRFLGLTPSMTVVEILPGGGKAYWTEILAPYLRDKGKYVAAIADDEAASDARKRVNTDFRNKLVNDPQLYDRAQVNLFGTDRRDIAPPNSADMVLTFRNLHNWMASGDVEAVLESIHKALKPGGILGIEEHRGSPDQPQDPAAKSGYVREDYAIALIEKAGFRLEAASEVNANPKDTKDHPGGVWTLPPSYRLGDQDRAKYAEIGESDRFLLRFVKAPK